MAVSDLAVFHAHACGQDPLLIGRGLVRGIDLAIGDGDATGFPRQIQRPLQLDARLVVGPARLLLLRKRERRVRPKFRLRAGTLRHIDLCAHGAKRGLPFERPCDRVIQRQSTYGVDIG